MFIQPFEKYIVLCQGVNQQKYRWHLDVVPKNKAWEVVGCNINVGEKFKGYFILSIVKIVDGEAHRDVFSQIYSIASDVPFPSDILLGKSSEEWYQELLTGTGFKLAPKQSYSGFPIASVSVDNSTYRCDICGGKVVNDICTKCMFDWDTY